MHDKKYLTIKEASKLYGKHPDTIRRAIQKNKEAYKKDKANKILIKVEALDAVFKRVAPTEQGKTIEGLQEPQQRLIDALLNELEQKNTIIAQQQETIRTLAEQQNQLISQQQQLSGYMLSAQPKKRKFLLFGRKTK